MVADKKLGVANELDVMDSIKCREIVQEILDFGCNQKQLLTIIKLLALELENNKMMKEVIAITNRALEEKYTDKTTILV